MVFDLSISASVSPGQYLIEWQKKESSLTDEYLDILNSILIVQESSEAYASLSKPTFDIEEFHFVYANVATNIRVYLS